MINHFSQEEFEGTFHIEDADLQKMVKVLSDVNIKECPYFDLSDKYGNSARYYRENPWIPCSERLPEEKKEVLVSADGDLYIAILETINGKSFWSEVIEYRYIMGVVAWMPLPEPYKAESEEA